jgi:hypothetical protein
VSLLFPLPSPLDPFLSPLHPQLVDNVVEVMSDGYPELAKDPARVKAIIQDEEETFRCLGFTGGRLAFLGGRQGALDSTNGRPCSS